MHVYQRNWTFKVIGSNEHINEYSERFMAFEKRRTKNIKQKNNKQLTIYNKIVVFVVS